MGAVGYLALLVIASTQYAKTTPELLEQARAQVQEYVDQSERLARSSASASAARW